LAKLGLATGWSQPAEYAQAAAATRSDMLYVARRASPGAKAVLCDYAHLAPLAPYALAPDSPALVVMHDLISARVADPAAEAATRKVASMSRQQELALLSLCDAVVAIQADEAREVSAALPAQRVLVVPHGVDPVAAAQPGADDSVLFVGSNTAPNIVGLEWFFRDIWPLLKAARADAQLLIAGSVNRAMTAAPDGVRFLGVVDDLAPLYRQAGVVISPLYTGSGLKIKLIEAMAAGKAVVGASVTSQGVEHLVADSMIAADDPAEFAAAVAGLLGDRAARERLGGAALQCAQAHFATEAAFRELTAYIRGNAAELRERMEAAAPG
jgi:succinoglycan biosynthesis protein ExoO